MTDELKTEAPAITVLGIGNILLTDEGFGVRVVEKLYSEYKFPENVTLVDGGLINIFLGPEHGITTGMTVITTKAARAPSPRS